MTIKTYEITPMGKPRMTQRDKWSKRPAVLRYWAFKAECRAYGVQIADNSEITFVLAMPKSWSSKKRAEMFGEPHRQKPDIDNLVKAVLDSVFDDDAAISEIHARKIWGERSYFTVRAK